MMPLLLTAMIAATPGEELCTSLLAQRDQARKEGRLDFAAVLDIEHNVAAPRIEAGEPFTVGRITFHGHHAFGDATLRRALTFDEGELLDLNRLNTSLGKLAAFGAAEAHIRRDDRARVAHIDIAIQEAQSGSWLVAVDGPTLTMRVVRMHLPGQEWMSGIAWSPQASLRAVGAAWGLQQLRSRIAPAPARADPLIVEVQWPGARAMLCEPRGPRWKWLRVAAGVAVDWGLPMVLY